jgi:hypothetical protein
MVVFDSVPETLAIPAGNKQSAIIICNLAV